LISSPTAISTMTGAFHLIAISFDLVLNYRTLSPSRRPCQLLKDQQIRDVKVADCPRFAWGIARSLWIYHRPERRRRMDRFYSRFVRPGDLVFDIGAHVGDRTGAFSRLGCRVIAVEPQPPLVALLRRFYGRSAAVRIEPVAIAAASGTVELLVNLANPTLTTASPAFVAAAGNAKGWRNERWGHRLHVSAVTLDQLIERHGEPSFLKLDVEGFEAEALAGLSRAVQALSFEFTTIERGIASRCLARCCELGPYRFNASLGEIHRLAFAEWVDAGEMAHWLESLPDSANSGDIYARL
jgi:FkbM family methyltransferase